MTLTDRFVDTIKSLDGKRADFTDGKVRGLVLRVTPTGAKSWALRYCRKSDGKQQRLTLGRYPGLTLAQARAKATEFLADVEKGEDPAKTTKRPAAAERPRTFGELAERYINGHAAKKKAGTEDEAMLRNDVLPAIEGHLLTSVHRADIAAILDTIIERGAEIRANRTFAVIRKAFNWGIEKGFIDTSPIVRMKAPSKERSRDRVLSNEEIRVFWRRTIAATSMDWEMRQLLRICLVTGQRISEVAGATRSELDFDKGIWLIPPERAKNSTGHLVPLSPLALRLFRQAAARSTHDELILPSRTTGRPILKYAPSMAMRRAMSVYGFTKPATPHDLRRTCGSGFAELGFSRLIQDKVLNHRTGDRGISAVYDRWEYAREKREALEAWATHLNNIIFRTRRKAGMIISQRTTVRSASPWAQR